MRLLAMPLVAMAVFPTVLAVLMGARISEGAAEEIETPEDAAATMRAAKRGDPDAQNNLGYIHQEGRGVPQSDTEAVIWYRLAAKQGYLYAQYNLGYMHQEGRGVPQSDTEAVIWYRLAAKQGYSNAQYNLGNKHYNGRGVPQSDTEAVKWYKLAAEQGNAAAQFYLGYMHQVGRGVPQSYTEASKWYKLAAEQGNAAMQFILGLMNAFGIGVPQDYTRAAAYCVVSDSTYSLAALTQPGLLFDAFCPPKCLAAAKQLAVKFKRRFVEKRDCKFSEWSEWSPCNATCGNDTVRTRHRTVAMEARNGGAACMTPMRIETARCAGLPQCRLKCPVGKFANEDAQRCMSCHHRCLGCFGKGPASCTSCKPSGRYPYLQHDQCLDRCMIGFYPAETHARVLVCAACDELCNGRGCHGEGPSNCRTCRQKQLINLTCVAKCPAGLTPDDTGTCYDVSMSPVVHFLRKIGLPQYTERFHAEEITLSMMDDLTTEDLKEIGVSVVGHRKKIQREAKE
jgi:hypothetical protein